MTAIMQAIRREWAFALLVAAICLLAMLGCASQQRIDQAVAPAQEVVTPQTVTPATPTTITIKFEPWNGPGSDEGSTEGSEGEVPEDAELLADATNGTTAVKRERARYVQVNNVWIDTSASGSTGATATASGSGSQSASGSQEATQEQKPEAGLQITVAPAIGTSPRVVIEQTQAYKGDAAGAPIDANQSGDTLEAMLRSMPDDPLSRQLLELLERWQAARAPTSAAPGTQPAA